MIGSALNSSVELPPYLPPRELLSRLRSVVGLTDGELARATGASARSVRRWHAGGPISADYAERLDDLRMVVMDLGDALPPELIGGWLRARNRLLDRARPIDMLGNDGYTSVARALEAVQTGQYG